MKKGKEAPERTTPRKLQCAQWPWTARSTVYGAEQKGRGRRREVRWRLYEADAVRQGGDPG